MHPIRYFKDRSNIIDCFALSFYFFNAILLLSTDNPRDDFILSIYVLTMVTAFIKLYNNLTVLDTFRELSNSLFQIFVELKAFVVLFI